MTFAKTSIFFFCLILGTSVFPSGSSTGLVYAKPSADYLNQRLRELGNRIDNQVPSTEGLRTYGSLTNQIGNEFIVNKVKGEVTFGSDTHQKYNDFTDNLSPASKTIGSITNQSYNSYQIANVESGMTVGSSSHQENNKF